MCIMMHPQKWLEVCPKLEEARHQRGFFVNLKGGKPVEVVEDGERMEVVEDSEGHLQVGGPSKMAKRGFWKGIGEMYNVG
jgi:hypothetical protein